MTLPPLGEIVSLGIAHQERHNRTLRPVQVGSNVAVSNRLVSAGEFMAAARPPEVSLTAGAHATTTDQSLGVWSSRRPMSQHHQSSDDHNESANAKEGQPYYPDSEHRHHRN